MAGEQILMAIRSEIEKWVRKQCLARTLHRVAGLLRSISTPCVPRRADSLNWRRYARALAHGDPPSDAGGSLEGWTDFLERAEKTSGKRRSGPRHYARL
jgi:hypothetical protein